MKELGPERSTARTPGTPKAARRRWFFIAAACFGLLVAGCKESKADAGPGPAPALEGQHGDGGRFSLEKQRGKVVVLAFGYTYCPDVCPMTLATLKRAYAALGNRKQDVKVVFASVDPKRDSAKAVADYAAAFDPAFIGVRLDHMESTVQAFEVTVSQRFPDNSAAAKVADTDREGFYFVDHTGLFFLIDRAGLLQKKLPVQADHQELAREIEGLLG
jgi:protein SCO1/2